MTVATRRERREQPSEEAVAAARVVLGLTLGVGAMAALIGTAGGDSLSIVAVPTLVLAASLALILAVRRAVRTAGYAAAAVWLVLLPHAHAEAMLGPLVMSVVCLAIAVGPDRMFGWIGRDVRGEAPAASPAPEQGADQGWIEEA